MFRRLVVESILDAKSISLFTVIVSVSKVLSFSMMLSLGAMLSGKAISALGVGVTY